MFEIHILTHRLVSNEDVESLNKLRAILNDECGLLTHTTIVDTTARGNNIIFVARVDGNIVGMIVLERSGIHSKKRTGTIKSFIVDEKHRGAGVGTKLLSRAIGVADLSGVEELRLRARTDRVQACRLYQKIGFEFCPGSTTTFFRTHDRPKPG